MLLNKDEQLELWRFYFPIKPYSGDIIKNPVIPQYKPNVQVNETIVSDIKPVSTQTTQAKMSTLTTSSTEPNRRNASYTQTRANKTIAADRQESTRQDIIKKITELKKLDWKAPDKLLREWITAQEAQLKSASTSQKLQQVNKNINEAYVLWRCY